MMKNKKEYIISAIKKRIKSIDPNAQIILFGSRARNENKKNSDWDFLILTNLNISESLKKQIFDEFFETELETDEVLTAIIQNKIEWNTYSQTPIFSNIKKDGILL